MRAKINALDARLPVRYSFMVVCALGVLLALFSLIVFNVGWLALLVCTGLTGVGVHDLRQTWHAILRNYPVIGHLRFLFEFIWPEIRQYLIENDAEAAPFSRAQRSLVYQRAKGSLTVSLLERIWMCASRATNGSTIRWHQPGCPRMTSASGLAVRQMRHQHPFSLVRSPTRPVCSTSRH